MCVVCAPKSCHTRAPFNVAALEVCAIRARRHEFFQLVAFERYVRILLKICKMHSDENPIPYSPRRTIGNFTFNRTVNAYVTNVATEKTQNRQHRTRAIYISMDSNIRHSQTGFDSGAGRCAHTDTHTHSHTDNSANIRMNMYAYMSYALTPCRRSSGEKLKS